MTGAEKIQIPQEVLPKSEALQGLLQLAGVAPETIDETVGFVLSSERNPQASPEVVAGMLAVKGVYTDTLAHPIPAYKDREVEMLRAVFMFGVGETPRTFLQALAPLVGSSVDKELAHKYSKSFKIGLTKLFVRGALASDFKEPKDDDSVTVITYRDERRERLERGLKLPPKKKQIPKSRRDGSKKSKRSTEAVSKETKSAQKLARNHDIAEIAGMLARTPEEIKDMLGQS